MFKSISLSSKPNLLSAARERSVSEDGVEAMKKWRLQDPKRNPS